MHAHPRDGGFELCSPHCHVLGDPVRLSWVKLGLTVSGWAGGCRRGAWVALKHMAGCQQGSGLLGTRWPHTWHMRVHPEWGVLTGEELLLPSPACGAPQAGPVLAPSREGVMCQHGAPDKDSDCIRV